MNNQIDTYNMLITLISIAKTNNNEFIDIVM